MELVKHYHSYMLVVAEIHIRIIEHNPTRSVVEIYDNGRQVFGAEGETGPKIQRVAEEWVKNNYTVVD